ncbi:SH3 domain-containing protein [Aestuariibius sp. 2305UL40-4]|uniref:SH3 domain-containing protein n=1 Tax=Aestuariibius violaceus TaxID=3234132 RepID=UPI00345F003C
MHKLMIVTFGALAWMWWELSGGSDFRPMSEIVAEAQAADQGVVEVAEAEEVTPAPTQEIVARADLTPASLPILPASAEQTFAEELPVPTPAVATSDTGFIADERVVEVAAEPAADLRAVAGSRVNMRAGPGTSHGVIATLSRGDAVEVIDTNGAGWLQLRAVDLDRVGWMAERLVTD